MIHPAQVENQLAGPDGRGGLLANPFNIEFHAPDESVNVVEAVKGLRLLSRDQWESITTSIRLGRIAGQEVLWRYGPIWDDWPHEERQAWDIFARYSGVIYHNYRYQYAQKKDQQGVDSLAQLPLHEIKAAAELGQSLADDFAGLVQMVE